MMLRTPEVLQEVVSSRYRQERDKREFYAQSEGLWTLDDPNVTSERKLAQLVTQMGEVAQGVSVASEDDGHTLPPWMRRALIELATDAVAWAEALS